MDEEGETGFTLVLAADTTTASSDVQRGADIRAERGASADGGERLNMQGSAESTSVKGDGGCAGNAIPDTSGIGSGGLNANRTDDEYSTLGKGLPEACSILDDIGAAAGDDGGGGGLSLASVGGTPGVEKIAGGGARRDVGVVHATEQGGGARGDVVDVHATEQGEDARQVGYARVRVTSVLKGAGVQALCKVRVRALDVLFQVLMLVQDACCSNTARLLCDCMLLCVDMCVCICV